LRVSHIKDMSHCQWMIYHIRPEYAIKAPPKIEEHINRYLF
jgi:hypothetical protein